MQRPVPTFTKPKAPIIRLATSDCTEQEIEDVRQALAEGKRFIYWGNGSAQPADYVFVHEKGQTTVTGVLKLLQRQPARWDLIDDASFALHRPREWRTERTLYEKFYVVGEARRVHYPIERLVNRWNAQLDPRGMHDSVFVSSPLFEPF